MDWKAGDTTKEDYHRLRAKTDAQVQQLSRIIGSLATEQAQRNEGVSTNVPLFDAFLQNQSIWQLDSGPLAALIEVIYVHANKEITLVFKSSGQFARVMAFAAATQTAPRSTQS